MIGLFAIDECLDRYAVALLAKRFYGPRQCYFFIGFRFVVVLVCGDEGSLG